MISESLKNNSTLTKLNLYCDEIRNKNEKHKREMKRKQKKNRQPNWSRRSFKDK